LVGRKHQSLVITLGREQGRDRNRGTRIAAHRFEHDVGLDTAFAQLLCDDEAEVGMSDDDRPREEVGIQYARKHLLKRRP
jgi:hypothetical protein